MTMIGKSKETNFTFHEASIVFFYLLFHRSFHLVKGIAATHASKRSQSPSFLFHIHSSRYDGIFDRNEQPFIALNFLLASQHRLSMSLVCTPSARTYSTEWFTAWCLYPVVCLRGGERGTCLGYPLFGGPPLRYYAHKLSLFLVKDVLFTHVMCYKANHKEVFCFQRAPLQKM